MPRYVPVVAEINAVGASSRARLRREQSCVEVSCVQREVKVLRSNKQSLDSTPPHVAGHDWVNELDVAHSDVC